MKSPFVPDNLPLEQLELGCLVSEIGEANRRIAAFGGLLMGIPNPYVLLSPLTAQEAVLSSKIEGTQATLQEMLQFEAGERYTNGNRVHDIQEILNYRMAMSNAMEILQQKPLTLNLIKQIHYILLESVRGKNMRRGEFRRNQNHIGKPGSTIEEASYIPPSPEKVLPLLDNWEKYIHYQEVDPLVQISIVHAQFEIIHPFMDGNGRIGRMLIPLFLSEKGIIPYPTFYLSAYLESHRDEYYDKLSGITSQGNWLDWIRFFLTAIISESGRCSNKARAILDLHNETKNDIVDWTRSQYSMSATDIIFSTPILSSTLFSERSNIPKPTAARILKILIDKQVLRIIRPAKGQSPAIMAFPELLDIVES